MNRMRVVLFALAAAAATACGGGQAQPAKPTPVEPARPAELTTGEAVLEASLVAQGGRERIGQVKAMRQTGVFGSPAIGMKGPVTVVSAPPRNLLMTIELPGLGKIVSGASGDVAWAMEPMSGARVLSGDELTQTLRDAEFNADLHWKTTWPKAELAGVVDFHGEPAYKVVLTATNGDTQTRYYSKATLLPAGSQQVAKAQAGAIQTESTLGDWREVGGIKYPHKIVQKVAGQSFEVLIDKVETNPALDPSTFALPAEIAALLEKPSDTAAPAAPAAPAPAAPAKTPAPAKKK